MEVKEGSEFNVVEYNEIYGQKDPESGGTYVRLAWYVTSAFLCMPNKNEIHGVCLIDKRNKAVADIATVFFFFSFFCSKCRQVTLVFFCTTVRLRLKKKIADFFCPDIISACVPLLSWH